MTKQLQFRQLAPVRTCTEKYSSYKKYKKHLRIDFHKRCGYTDCPDFWFGGAKTFHIDHFLPQKKYPTLACEYSNLVYTCSYVNILKSDDDVDFLDPCREDLNLHFYRTINGEIRAKAESHKAKYMYDKMKLYLKRYSIIWMLEQIGMKLEILLKYQNKLSKDNDHYITVLELISDLSREYMLYLNYLQDEQ